MQKQIDWRPTQFLLDEARTEYKKHVDEYRTQERTIQAIERLVADPKSQATVMAVWLVYGLTGGNPIQGYLLSEDDAIAMTRAKSASGHKVFRYRAGVLFQCGNLELFATPANCGSVDSEVNSFKIHGAMFDLPGFRGSNYSFRVDVRDLTWDRAKPDAPLRPPVQDILTAFTDALNAHGPESTQVRALRDNFSSDPQIKKLFAAILNLQTNLVQGHLALLPGDQQTKPKVTDDGRQILWEDNVGPTRYRIVRHSNVNLDPEVQVQPVNDGFHMMSPGGLREAILARAVLALAKG